VTVNRQQTIVWWHTALLVCSSCAFIAVIAINPFNTNTNVAAILMYMLFYGMPVAVCSLWFLQRSRGGVTREQRRALFTLRGSIVIVWLMVSVPFVLYVVVLQGWPVSMIQGPDTGYAREGYARVVRTDPPETVSAVYYRVHGWDDETRLLRFMTTGTDEVDQIVARYDLVPVPEPGHVSVGPHPPLWWLSREQAKACQHYSAQGEGGTLRSVRLWHDQARGIVWLVVCYS
jgi:hypothetical protein